MAHTRTSPRTLIGTALLLLLLACNSPGALSWSLSPFHPKDLLPALPHEIAWPVLNTFSNAVDLLPKFVSTVGFFGGNTTSWTGSCFTENHAYIEHTENGAILHIQVRP
jgi:hypothetical protein